MRLFTAIELPDDAKNHLRGIQADLQRPSREIEGGKWVDAGKLHLNMKFLGEVAQEILPEIKRAFESVEVDAMTLFADRFYRLPPRGAARVFAARVGGDVERLALLFERIEAACEQFGVHRERRRFLPHVTIGRVRDGLWHHDPLFNFDLSHRSPGPAFATRSFTLFKSTLTSDGPIYESLGKFGEKFF